MGNRLTQTMRQALLIPDARVVDTTFIEVNDGGAANSAYTEAGPRPGSAITSDPLAKLRPLISGGQTAKVDLLVNQSGLPGRDGMRAVWRIGGGADADYRGWNHPVFLAGWSMVDWASGAGADDHLYHDIAVIPSSQRPICVYSISSFPASSACRLWGWDSPGAWGAAVTIATGAFGAGGTPAILVMPGTERILIWLPIAGVSYAHYSDNAGATWSVYSADIFRGASLTGSVGTYARARAAYHAST